MHAVVPAAGEGTRLRPLTADRPKGLVEVAGKPLLAHVFETLDDLPVSEVVVVVGHRGDAIVDHFGDAYRDLSLQYVRQPEPRGLGDAVLQVDRHVEGDFLVLNGDNVVDADLSPVLEHHRQEGPTATLPVRRVSPDEARTTGVAVVEDGRVRSVVEKVDDPPSTLALSGVYVLPPATFDACREVEPGPTGEVELSAAIDRLIQSGARVNAVPFPGWRRNVNTPADIEAVERRLAGE